MARRTLPSLLSVLCIVLFSSTVRALPNEVFFADFPPGPVPPEFSAGGTSVAQIGPEAINQGLSRYLGKFTTTGSTTLTLTGLPPHTQLELEFDVYFFRSWDGSAPPADGPDFFSLAGDINFSATFTNHRQEGQTFPVGADVYLNDPGTALSSFGDPTATMAFFRIGPSSTGSSFIIPHTGDTFTVTFGGPTTSGDEQWGIDNVRVSVGSAATVPAAVPTTGNWGLAILCGLLVLLTAGWMKRGHLKG